MSLIHLLPESANSEIQWLSFVTEADLLDHNETYHPGLVLKVYRRLPRAEVKAKIAAYNASQTRADLANLTSDEVPQPAAPKDISGGGSSSHSGNPRQYTQKPFAVVAPSRLAPFRFGGETSAFEVSPLARPVERVTLPSFASCFPEPWHVPLDWVPPPHLSQPTTTVPTSYYQSEGPAPAINFNSRPCLPVTPATPFSPSEPGDLDGSPVSFVASPERPRTTNISTFNPKLISFVDLTVPEQESPRSAQSFSGNNSLPPADSFRDCSDLSDDDLSDPRTDALSPREVPSEWTSTAGDLASDDDGDDLDHGAVSDGFHSR